MCYVFSLDLQNVVTHILIQSTDLVEGEFVFNNVSLNVLFCLCDQRYVTAK